VVVGPALGERESSFRRDIEGLRGIAILVVVAYHVGIPGFSGGFVGVDIFFVLSGYLITKLLVREALKTGRVNLVNFYARRVRRLLPACGFMLLAVCFLGTRLFSPLEQSRIWPSAGATAGYCSNFLFMRQSMDYFDAETAGNPLLHTWSLAVEEQFYLVWPALVILAARSRRFRIVLPVILVAGSALSLGTCIFLTHVRQPWAFFASPTRAWEFGVGSLASLIPTHVVARRHGWFRGVGWLGGAAVLAAALFFSASTNFPGIAAVIPVAGAAAMILPGTISCSAGVSRLLAIPVLQWLGKLSYSWYLWHWPVLIGASVAGLAATAIGRAGWGLVSLAVAAVTYAVIENPARFNPVLMQRPVLSLLMGALITVGGIGAALAWRQSVLTTAARFPEAAIFDAAKARPNPAGCSTGYADARVKQCVAGDKSAGRTVVLFGDSHAEQWLPALEQVAAESRFKIITVLKASCPTARVQVYNPHLKRVEVECAEWREAALVRIGALRPDALIATNSSMGYISAPGKEGGYETSSYEEWREGSRSTFAALDSAGIETLVLRDSPRPNLDVPLCLSRADSKPWSVIPQQACSPSRAKALDPLVLEAEEQAARGLQRVHFADLTGEFCDSNVCASMKRNVVVYRDSNHLATTFAKGLAPALARQLLPLLSSGSTRASGSSHFSNELAYQR
jgi:peptidoglycan/LPS O-acetylase OafA/YrhL